MSKQHLNTLYGVNINMKHVKKTCALLVGLMLMSLSAFTATAYNLENYPAPFVEACSFSGAITVGEAAAAEDVVGAIDIASSLAISGTKTEAEETVSVDGEAVKIESSSNKLNIGDKLTDVISVSLDEDDMETVLAEGTYTADDGDDFDYEQNIEFGDNLEFKHFSDSDYEDGEPVLGVMIPKGEEVLTYTLDFSKTAKSDKDGDDLVDFKDSSIVILNREYNIVEADDTISLELMGGSISDVLEQAQTKTYSLNDEEYEIEVTYIGESSSTSKAKFKINGELTDALEEGDTYKLDDKTQLGVKEILEEEAGEVTADQVEFYIGAEKITLTDGQELQENDEDVDDVTVVIDGTPADGEIDSIEITWTAEDDLFVTEDNEVIMPGLDALKLVYSGFTTEVEEETAFTAGGEETIVLETVIEDGDVSIELVSSDGTDYINFGGDDTDEGLVLTDSTAGIEDIVDYLIDTHQYFIATYISDVGDYGESYLLEISDVDDTDGVDIDNVVTGNTEEENLKKGEIFEIGNVKLELDDFSETNGYVNISDNNTDTTYFNKIVTEEGLLIDLSSMTLGTATIDVNVSEEDRNNNLASGETITVRLGHNGDEVQVNSYSGDTGYEIDDSDEYVDYTSFGTKLLFDKGGDQDELTIKYHGEEAYGNLYLSETETGFTTEVTESSSCNIKVPSARLDSEITDISAQNLIVVGGPCANSVAASLLGVEMNYPACADGFEEGKAMIKAVDTDDVTALIVAGFSALDTRKATTVLSDYGNYNLEGDELIVVGTSLSDVEVQTTTENITEG